MRLSAAGCLAGLRTSPSIRHRIRRLSQFIGGAAVVYIFIYLVWFTPLLVYILDYLNLRPFFLPNIVCDRCNNFTYEYPVDNHDFCSSGGKNNGVGEGGKENKGVEGVFLLILVATYHPNMNARQAIRASWGNVTVYRGQRIKTLFMFGWHEDKNYNYQVRYELENYGDVIQGNFTDNYRTLTNKTMMGLRWVRAHCAHAQYVLKTDDDAFNVPQRYVDYLLTRQGTDKFVGGYCFTVMPDRRDGSKFYTPYSMYPDQYYPTYCSGPGYILSRDAVQDIVAVAPDVIFLTMEDVFVSGLCRVAAHLAYTQIPGTAEDQRAMTRCNLATWVKNGHNIYPLAVPAIWQRVVTSNRHVDCASYNIALVFCLIVGLTVWFMFLWRLVVPRIQL